jgi:hypothetical protein
MTHQLIRDGRPTCIVVVARRATETQRLAADVLRDHLQQACGKSIPLVDERAASASHDASVQLVITDASAGFAAEQYTIRSDGSRILFAGHDEGPLFGAPHDIVGESSPGTLYAVYHFLDRYVGVRWLWPGDAGTYVPRHCDLSVPDLDVRTRPDLEQRRINVPQNLQPESLHHDAILWGYAHHFGNRTDLRFVHSFPHWWEQYHEQYPHLFAAPPEGQSQPFPRERGVKLCVSQPDVVDFIVEEWRSAGRPASWCVGPNDGAGWCTCANCRTLDNDPGQSMADIWHSRGVCLTGRYTHLWNQLLPRLRTERPDARLSCYAYSTYRETRADTSLHEGVVLAVVHTYDERARQQWRNWSAVGAQLFLRPNWFHMGACFPHLPLHRAGDWLCFARGEALCGIWFDSLLGYWATQGPFYYLVARMGARPDLSVDDIIDEYCRAFGAAAGTVRDYLAYWEARTEELAVPVPAGGALSQNVDGLHERTCRDMGINVHPLHASWHILPVVAADPVLAPARDLLATARVQADGDALVLARLDFLSDGLDHLARVRDVIAAADAGDHETAVRRREKLCRREDELTQRHVVWGPSLRHNLARRRVRPWHDDGAALGLDGM